MKFYDLSSHRTKEISKKDILGWKPWNEGIAIVCKQPIWKKGDSLQKRTLLVSMDQFCDKIVGVKAYNVFKDKEFKNDLLAGHIEKGER